MLGLTTLACSASLDAPEEPGTPVPVNRLRAEPYSFADNSGMRESERLVVRDETTWRTVWAAIWRNSTTVPEVPSIDFAREMLVVAALGQRGTGGFGILVESARMTNDGLAVRIRTFAPGARCVTTQALTQPVDVARLPRSDGAVRFRDVAVVVDCK
jgi:hypothetical protein